MSTTTGFTATQTSVINELVAKAVAEAIGATMQAMTTATDAVPALPTPALKLTLAQAKNQSITQRLAHGVASVNNAIGNGGNWAADKLSSAEVQAKPFIQMNAGIVLGKTAVAAISTGAVLSSWADRCAAAYAKSRF